MQGLGVDLIEIGRVEAALERRPRLAERIFTPGELAYARGHARPGRHLAARFAAKEAVVKALGGGGLPLSEIEIVGYGGQPSVRLHGRTAELGRNRTIRVSMTHSREAAAAVADVGPAAGPLRPAE